MNDLFQSDTAGASEDFIALRCNPRNAKIKKLAQEMWQIFFPLADPNFPQQFSQNVHSRFWEMYLGVRLLERGFQFVKKESSYGPDFHILIGEKNVWIEATAPDDGSGNDAVPSIYELTRFTQVPEDKIILRFTNAITMKLKKLDEYLKNGIIASNDIVVFALNGGGINMTSFEGPLPAIIRSVYPVGNHSITVDVNTLKPIKEVYQTRSEVYKLSGSSVRTNAFLEQSYAGVSGIIYSNANIGNIPTNPSCEFLYIDNFIANIHLDVGWLGTGKYCYKEENNLKIDDLL